jgi:hypothetical protein
MQTLISNKVLQFNNPVFSALLNEVDTFCSHFNVIKEAAELAKHMRKFSGEAGK